MASAGALSMGPVSAVPADDLTGSRRYQVQPDGSASRGTITFSFTVPPGEVMLPRMTVLLYNATFTGNFTALEPSITTVLTPHAGSGGIEQESFMTGGFDHTVVTNVPQATALMYRMTTGYDYDKTYGAIAKQTQYRDLTTDPLDARISQAGEVFAAGLTAETSRTITMLYSPQSSFFQSGYGLPGFNGRLTLTVNSETPAEMRFLATGIPGTTTRTISVELSEFNLYIYTAGLVRPVVNMTMSQPRSTAVLSYTVVGYYTYAQLGAAPNSQANLSYTIPLATRIIAVAAKLNDQTGTGAAYDTQTLATGPWGGFAFFDGTEISNLFIQINGQQYPAQPYNFAGTNAGQQRFLAYGEAFQPLFATGRGSSVEFGNWVRNPHYLFYPRSSPDQRGQSNLVVFVTNLNNFPENSSAVPPGDGLNQYYVLAMFPTTLSFKYSNASGGYLVGGTQTSGF